MASTADFLELLATSESRWSTLRAAGREWRRPAILHEAWEADIARLQGQSISFSLARAGSTADSVPAAAEPDEREERWRLWIAPPWKRAQFHVGPGLVDVVFHHSTWWSNSHDASRTNDGAANIGHGSGDGADLLRTAEYVPLIEVDGVRPGSWLGRSTLDVRVRAKELSDFARFPLHGLIVGAADHVLVSVDAERGVLLRTEAFFGGVSYRIVEMTEVAFDEVFDETTFAIEPTKGAWESGIPERIVRLMKRLGPDPR